MCVDLFPLLPVTAYVLTFPLLLTTCVLTFPLLLPLLLTTYVLPFPQLQMDVLLSQDLLLRSVSVEQLPPALDGSYPYSHEEWVRFRMVSIKVLHRSSTAFLPTTATT